MKNLNRYSVIAAAAALCLAAGAAQAQSGFWGNWHRDGMMTGWDIGSQGRGYGRAMVMDLNDDGRISEEEAAVAAADVFSAMDADDDGSLTEDEYMSVSMGPGAGWNEERQATMQANKQARFKEMDADGDGSVSKGEFLDAAKAHHKASDSDGDGVVTPWEQRRRNWF